MNRTQKTQAIKNLFFEETLRVVFFGGIEGLTVDTYHYEGMFHPIERDELSYTDLSAVEVVSIRFRKTDDRKISTFGNLPFTKQELIDYTSEAYELRKENEKEFINLLVIVWPKCDVKATVQFLKDMACFIEDDQ